MRSIYNERAGWRMSILAFRQKIALWVDMYDLLWRVIIESYQVYENMQTVNQYILEEYIAQQSISVEFEQYLKSWPLTGHLKLTNMTTTKIHDLCLKINSHDIITPPTSLEVATGNQIAWKKGELKLFLWVLVYYCFHHDTHIISLKDQDFLFLGTIFPRKSLHRIKFEAYSMAPSKMCSKLPWENQQTSLLTKIIQGLPQNHKRLEWKEVAFELFTLSEGCYFRTNAQCRERWTNHINPKINHDKWTREEDYILISMMQSDGTKWADIVKVLKGSRTEHMVKNRYHSLINKWKKTKSKWSNHQIEKRIIELIKRTARRGGKSLPEYVQLQKKQEHNQQREEVQQCQQASRIEKDLIEEEDRQISQESRVSEDKFSSHSSTIIKQENSVRLTDKNSQAALSPSAIIIEPVKYSFYGISSFHSDFNLSYYRDEKIKLAMEDVAQQLGCHVEQVERLFNDFDYSMSQHQEGHYF